MTQLSSNISPDAPPRRRPRLGFLGTGFIGRHRLRAIVDSRSAEIAGIADESTDALEKAGAIAPGTPRLRELEQLLKLDLDGLVIATPSALHADQALAALDRGVAVFCQKPLARSSVETESVVEAARRADRLLAVDLSYRHTAAMQAIKELIDRGDLGRIYSVQLAFHNAFGPDRPWFYDKRLSGGGCVMDLGTHLVDLALWALGRPKVAGGSSQLFAAGERIEDDTNDVEDYATARLDLDNGVVVHLACSWRCSNGADAVIEASFFGTQGTARMKNVNGSFYDFVGERLRATQCEVLVRPPDPWGGRAATRWMEQLARGAGFDPVASELLDLARVVDAIYGRASWTS